MCDLRRPAEMLAHFLLQFVVGFGYTLMLTQMLRPGFKQECFDKAAIIGGVLE